MDSRVSAANCPGSQLCQGDTRLDVRQNTWYYATDSILGLAYSWARVRSRGRIRVCSVKKKIFLALASTLVSLLVLEVILRGLWTNPYSGTAVEYIVKLRVNHPGLSLKVPRDLIDPEDPVVTYRQDGRGYTKPSFRFEKPDCTVAFLGGSTTECLAVREDLRFPALVSQKFEDKGLRVNSLNAARSGNTLHDSINLLYNHVVQDRPDVVVVMHAVNDAGLLRAKGGYDSRMGEYVELRTLGKYFVQWTSIKSSLCGLVRYAMTSGRCRRKDFEPDVAESEKAVPDPAPFRARLCVFVDMCRDLNITPVLMTQPLASTCRNAMTPDWADAASQKVFNEVTRDVSRAKKVLLIDLEAQLAQRVRDVEEAKKVFYDGMHVTDYGSQIYAEYIVAGMEDLLRHNPEQRAARP